MEDQGAQILVGDRTFTTNFGAVLARKREELREWLDRQAPVPLTEIEKGDHVAFNGATKDNCYRVEGEIEEIRLAEKRWENGTYGVCLDCGGGIPEERLILIPHAKRCAGCQGKNRKHY